MRSSSLARRPPAVRTLSPGSWRRVALPFGVLALEIVLFKLCKLEILVQRQSQATGLLDTDSALTAVVAQNAAPLILPLLVGTLLVLKLRSRLSMTARLCTVLATGGVLLGLMRLVLPEPPSWLSWDFVRAAHADLALLLAAAAAFALLLEHTRGRMRVATLTVLYLATAALMLIVSLDFGYFAVTGSLADAFLLRYALTNAADLTYVLGHELASPNLLIALVPLAVCAGAVWIERRARRQAETGDAPGLAWLVVPAVLLAGVPGAVSGAAAQLGSSSYASLLVDLFRSPPWEAAAPTDAPDEAPLFETRGLRFAAGAHTRPLNVVVVVLESQRDPSRLERGATPFLDRLATRALVIDELYAVVPHTNRALVPILCGIYPRIAQGFAADVPGECLPGLLRPHGYASAFFTTATLEFEQKGELLAAMGYDEVHGAEDLDGRGFEKINYFGYEERATLTPLLAWIERQQQAKRPFLATTLTLSPHHPYAVPRGHARRSVSHEHRAVDRYLDALGYVDGFVAELVSGLEARGLMESTLIVLVGDHGEAFGEHGLHFHSAVMWDEGLHVAGMLLVPGLEPGHVHGVRSQLDLLPTIADVLGLSLAGGALPGSSLLAPAPAERTLYHASWIENQSMALRRGTRKYVYHYRRAPLEAYDTAHDPLERTDLAGRMTPAETAAVELELLRWRGRVNQKYRR
jgi:phosphoglycerol transferase MdoB-like AlkP superfamily enzyme